MSASYNTVIRLESDTDFRERLRAAAAAAGVGDPYGWVSTNALKVALLDDVNSKYEYCLNASPYHSRPGYDPAVIPDQTITDAVTKILQTEQA